MNAALARSSAPHRPYATVRPIGGLTWTVESRNERSLTHAGRHFAAMRCKSGHPWRIFELDQNIVTHGGARILHQVQGQFLTEYLSDAIHFICDGRGFRSWECAYCNAMNHMDNMICHRCDAEPFEMLPYEMPEQRT